MKRELLPREQMAAELEKSKGSKIYKVQADEHRDERLAALLQPKIDRLNTEPSSRSNSIYHDIDLVWYRTREYLEACATAGAVPSMLGLSTMAFGTSQQALWKFCSDHPGDEVTLFIEQIKDDLADVVSQMALYRQVDPTFSIFWLKNLAGWRDNLELIAQVPAEPLGQQITQAQIIESLPQITDGDD